jgi:ferredoxin-type protein NapH
MRLRAIRRVIQLVSFSLMMMPAFWPANPVWVGSYISSSMLGVALTEPLAAAEASLAAGRIWWPLAWSVLPLLLITLLSGRIFCGWVCPLNTLFELIYIGKAPRNYIIRNGWWPYILLVILLTADWLAGLPLFTVISPIGALSRAVVFGSGFELAFVLALVAGEWLYRGKIWCRMLCPVGALYGIVGKWRQLKIVVDSANCRQCGQCHAVCSMGVNAGGTSIFDQLACTNCGDCIAACPEKLVHFNRHNLRKGGSKNESISDVTG